MSDNDNLPQHVIVPMNETGMSNGTIESQNFGPCVCMLVDFLFNGQPRCLLIHYSFDFDEVGLSLADWKDSYIESVINFGNIYRYEQYYLILKVVLELVIMFYL